MAKILVISDSHGYVDNLDKILCKIENDIDLIIHCGDSDNGNDIKRIESITKTPIEFVAGNCDFSSLVVNEKILDLYGKKIFLTHGNRYGVKSSRIALYKVAKEINADIVLYGHTHIAKSELRDGCLFLNPGSISGFEPSYAIVSIDNGEVLEEILEL